MHADVDMVDLRSCHGVTGVVVVVDVLRAFTTAAVAFARGAAEIRPVRTVEEALAARRADPRVLVLGEVGGSPVDEFDLDNSPTTMRGADVRDRILVHRSSAGTQGLVRSSGADVLLATGFPTAGATVRYLAGLAPAKVTFVATGRDAARDGDEDLACAEYIAALLRGQRPDPAAYVERIPRSTAGRLFGQPAHPEYPAADLDEAAAVDTFDRALVCRRRRGRMRLTAEEP